MLNQLHHPGALHTKHYFKHTKYVKLNGIDFIIIISFHEKEIEGVRTLPLVTQW